MSYMLPSLEEVFIRDRGVIWIYCISIWREGIWIHLWLLTVALCVVISCCLFLEVFIGDRGVVWVDCISIGVHGKRGLVSSNFNWQVSSMALLRWELLVKRDTKIARIWPNNAMKKAMLLKMSSMQQNSGVVRAAGWNEECACLSRERML